MPRFRVNPDGTKTMLVTPAEVEMASLKVQLDREAGREPEEWALAVAAAKPSSLHPKLHS